MTIAAGFKCIDSVVLCADHEMTYQTLKLPGRKIFPLNVPNREMNLAFAASGTINIAKSAFQAIKNSLLSLPKGVSDETSLQVFLEDELCKFYQKHLFKHPRFGYTDGPQISFVIAAQFKNDNSLSLFSTAETVVNPESRYCFCGNGEELAKYIVDPLALVSGFNDRPLREVLLVAWHMMRQVQKSAGNCGQGSSFFRLGKDGDFHDVYNFPLPLMDSYSDTFQDVVQQLFFASADLDMDDQRVKAGIRIADRSIKIIREEQRAELKRIDELHKQLYAGSKM